ncbi:hypothetical protein FDP41_001096 [Naegleria fowleri]|uniref:Coatomer subunit delta n=1 Tax=Naegleria fowleri TaxID=5763 RepID=A0A6A5BPJ2_NAEFO|nr:uncharacterized protein FDP41_001096 [Naegleria fowleri]KAF0979943.1 hypothetical protein FDP41_001096 [Naegleria fowleri]
MVVISVSVISKVGKPLVARQYRDISRVRLEGLLSAFPKLMDPKSQHTFVETDSVRYVYQSLDQLFLVLITTKTSNIVEDLETLQLFSRIIKDICFSNQRNSGAGLNEDIILSNAFDLMFAFDEIVSLGYRESVTLHQVKDILKMESQEENLQEAIKQRQIENARSQANLKATEIASRLALDGGKYTSGISSGDSRGMNQRQGDNVYVPPSSSNQGKYAGIGSNSSRVDSPSVVTASPVTSSFSSANGSENKNLKQQAKPSNLKQMILNRPNKKAPSSLLNDLVSTGDISAQPSETTAPVKNEIVETQKKVKVEDIHVEIKETLQVETNREGGLNSLDVKGEMYLTIAESASGFIKVRLENDLKDGFVSTSHPNIDKKMFTDEHCLALKRKDKAFPPNNPLKILTWRSKGNFDESILPFTVNCWPNPSGNETSVSIEYTLQDTNVELSNVAISVPIPTTNVTVESAESGTYRIDQKHNKFIWSFDLIDSSCPTGSIEFTVNERAEESKFFPVDISFTSADNISGVAIKDVLSVNDDSPQRFSVDRNLTVAEYKIV